MRGSEIEPNLKQFSRKARTLLSRDALESAGINKVRKERQSLGLKPRLKGFLGVLGLVPSVTSVCASAGYGLCENRF